MSKNKRRVVPPLDWGTETPQEKEQQSLPPRQHTRGPGRPPKVGADESMTSTTVRFRTEDLWYLDDQVTGIKRSGGDQTLTRSELLRAIVGALRRRGIELTSGSDEQSVMKLLENRLDL